MKQSSTKKRRKQNFGVPGPISRTHAAFVRLKRVLTGMAKREIMVVAKTRRTNLGPQTSRENSRQQRRCNFRNFDDNP